MGPERPVPESISAMNLSKEKEMDNGRSNVAGKEAPFYRCLSFKKLATGMSIGNTKKRVAGSKITFSKSTKAGRSMIG